jgi:Co/Zn/Cd efflux system component
LVLIMGCIGLCLNIVSAVIVGHDHHDHHDHDHAHAHEDEGSAVAAESHDLQQTDEYPMTVCYKRFMPSRPVTRLRHSCLASAAPSACLSQTYRQHFQDQTARERSGYARRACSCYWRCPQQCRRHNCRSCHVADLIRCTM